MSYVWEGKYIKGDDDSMNKKLVAIIAGVMVFLGACGANDEGASGDSPEVEAEESTDEEVANDTSEDSGEEETEELSDDTVEDDDYKFVIKDVEQIDGNYDSNVLALEVEFTNKSDESSSPWMAIVGMIKANQETETTIESLTGANAHFPEDYKPELVEMGDSDVKGDDTTVDAVIGFEIEFPGETIHLIYFNMMDKPETFERVVETE